MPSTCTWMRSPAEQLVVELLLSRARAPGSSSSDSSSAAAARSGLLLALARSLTLLGGLAARAVDASASSRSRFLAALFSSSS